MPLSAKTLTWLFIVVLLSGAGTAFTFWSYGQIEAASSQRMESRKVMQLTDALLLALKDTELSERGYVITGVTRYLQNYLESRTRVQQNFDALRQSTRHSALSQGVDAIAPVVNAEMNELAAVLATRSTDLPDAAIARVHLGEGQRLMDAVQTQVVALQRLQSETHIAHEAAFDISMRRMFTAIVALGVLALVFTLYFARSLYREAHHRIKRAVHQETSTLLQLQENTNARLRDANATLRLSQERLSVTLRSIGDAVIATDDQARITMLNPVAEVLTGWSQAHAMGLPIDEVFHIIGKDSRLPTPIPVGQALAKGVVQGLANHTVLVARDGQEFDIADSCAPIRNLDGAIVGTVLVFRNVTTQYQAQQALQDSAAVVRSIFDTVVDGIITIHAGSGTIDTTNPAVHTLFHYSAEELLCKNFALLVPELNAIALGTPLAYFGASSQAQKMGRGREVTGVRRDGSPIMLEIAVGEMRLRGERYFTALLRDVSTRKASEQALRKAQSLQRAMLSSANFAGIATDARGVIQIFNIGAQRLLGYTAAEVLNRMTPAEMVNLEDLAERAQELSESTSTSIPADFQALVFRAAHNLEDIAELRCLRRDGSLVPVLMSVSALRDDQDTVVGYLLIGTDNSGRIAMEADRALLDQTLKSKNADLELARNQADKANQAKSEFLSSMSHELRTPLGAILGFAQLLESGTPAPSATQQRSIDQILKAGWYLLELINEILDLALVESGRISLSMEPVSLNTVLDECQMMVEPQALKYGIRVVFNHCNTHHYVQADRTRLKQVLINLLGNAIKYNRPDGSVTVDCTSNDSDWISISVRDTGAGLTPEQMEQLFQPFNRLGQDTKGEEGTGIGLVVCKRLVELMGGQIGFASTRGEGSVFWFQLAGVPSPVAAAMPVSATDSTVTPRCGTRALQTLLYVEDNPANLLLVQDLMARRPDIRLLTAHDGNSGIEMARTHLPDVILMDINLPGISGIGAMRALANDPLTAHIPVIALSANAIPRDIERGLQAGFLRYLTKPIRIDAFMEAMDVGFDVADHAKTRALHAPAAAAAIHE